jgi:hypothetical protein
MAFSHINNQLDSHGVGRLRRTHLPSGTLGSEQRLAPWR